MMNRVTRALFKSFLKWNRQSIVASVPFTLEPSVLGLNGHLPKGTTLKGPEGVQAAIYYCFRNYPYSSSNADVALQVLKKLNEISLILKKQLEQHNASKSPPPDALLPFRIGQVVRCVKNDVRGIVIGWKYDAVEKKQMVNLLFDEHDYNEFVPGSETLPVYLPSDDLALVTEKHLQRAYSRDLRSYFTHFDAQLGRYIPQEAFAFLYPSDLPPIPSLNAQVLSEKGSAAARQIYRDLQQVRSKVKEIVEETFPGLWPSPRGASSSALPPFYLPPNATDEKIHQYTVLQQVIGDLLLEISEMIPLAEDYKVAPSATFQRKLLRGRRDNSKQTAKAEPKSADLTDLSAFHAVLAFQEHMPHENAAVFSAISRFSDVIFNIDQILQLRFQTLGIAFLDTIYYDAEQKKVMTTALEGKVQRALLHSTHPPLEFQVGEVVQHKQFHYRGVVAGYDMRPMRDVSQWEGVVSLTLGQEQPFYKVIPDERDAPNRRFYYVAQQNLERISDKSSHKIVNHRDLSTFFLGYDVETGRFRNAHKFKYCFPAGEQSLPDQYPSTTILDHYRNHHMRKEEDLDELNRLKQNIILEEIALYDKIDKLLLDIRGVVKNYLFQFITNTLPLDPSKVMTYKDIDLYATQQTKDLLTLLQEAPTREAALGIENMMWSAHVLSPSVDAMVCMRMGISELKRGNTAQALRAFQRCVSLDDKFAEGYNKLAVIYQAQGENKKCQEEAAKALQLCPHHYGAYTGMALACEKLRTKKKAEDYLRRVLELHPWGANIATILTSLHKKAPKA